MNFLLIFLLINVVYCNKARRGHLEGMAEGAKGGSHGGVSHYGTDVSKLMMGMVEIQRANGKRVFFKSEPTKTGSLETRVIIPDTQWALPQGMAQVGQPQWIEGEEQREEKQMEPQMGREEEMDLPNKRFVQ